MADIVHLPALMDSKYFGQLGDGEHLDIPKADVGIISGSIRNEEHLEVAEKMRDCLDGKPVISEDIKNNKGNLLYQNQ